MEQDEILGYRLLGRDAVLFGGDRSLGNWNLWRGDGPY